MKNNVTKAKDLCLYKKLELEHKYDDTRFYGIFFKFNKQPKRIKIDAIRFNKFFYLSETQKNKIKKAGTHYYVPSKRAWKDYSCNLFDDCIDKIITEWRDEFLPMVKQVVSEIRIKEFRPADSDLFNSGIIDYDEAAIETAMNGMQLEFVANRKKEQLRISLYAQFFHQMAAKIEAVTVRVLTQNGWKGTKFSRNTFYTFNNVKATDVKSLASFDCYDKLYAIWNFLKHNSLSTFETLKNSYPELIICTDDYKYNQGELAIYFIQFDKIQINDLLDGLKVFFANYCKLVLGENREIAQWDYDDWFLEKVNDEIETITNPLGLPKWI